MAKRRTRAQPRAQAVKPKTRAQAQTAVETQPDTEVQAQVEEAQEQQGQAATQAQAQQVDQTQLTSTQSLTLVRSLLQVVRLLHAANTVSLPRPFAHAKVLLCCSPCTRSASTAACSLTAHLRCAAASTTRLLHGC